MFLYNTQLPVRDDEQLLRLPGEPGVPERHLRLQPAPSRSRMLVFVARRIALAVVVVVGVIIVTFVVAHVVPGDPAATWAGPHASASPDRSGTEVPRPGPAAGRAAACPTSAGSRAGTGASPFTLTGRCCRDILTAAPASLELVITALLIAVASRDPARPDLRPAAWPASRPGHPGRLDPRRLDADLLDGADPAAGVLPEARVAARRGRVLTRPALHAPADQADRVPGARLDRRRATGRCSAARSCT